MSHAPPLSNHLLSALSPSEFEQLNSVLELVHLPLGQILYEPDQAIEYAYFPLDAVVGLLNAVEGGHGIETATVGNEGLIGVPLVLGAIQISMRAVVRVPGQAFRISAKALQTELLELRSLQLLLLRYVQTLMSQISQDLVCTQIHTTQERCCYLLLLMHDRIGRADLPLTYEGLARMVGIRRDSIGLIISTLERAGLVQHQRGRISVLDRAGLESAACDCYPIVRSDFDQISLADWVNPQLDSESE